MMRRAVPALVVLMLTAAPCFAGSITDPYSAGFTPRVPISQLGGMASWFDPSRLHLSSTIAVGSGFGSGTAALQTTSFSYQFKAPLRMNVSVGNAFGTGGIANSKFFLQGLDVAWQPSANSLLQIQFRNVRSPLQYGYGFADQGVRGPWGY